tara:strand:- start:553 stop:765 length:213 start_codon:yes stop_codon:yes gene_type:complete
MSRDINVQFKNQIKEQERQIKYLQGRMSDLVDNNDAFKNELNSFKKSVATDMERMYELVKMAGERHLLGK